MFWREDKYVQLNNEHPPVEDKPRKDRFVLRASRRRQVKDIERAQELLASYGIYHLVNGNFAKRYSAEEVEEKIEPPIGLPDIFSKSARDKLPILWEG